MFSGTPRRVLGLALGDKSIQVAEVHAARGGGRVVRADAFAVPSEADWKTPAALGAQLRAFLREKNFSAKHVVIGLPGRWLLMKSQTLPPATLPAAVSMLRLNIEREYVADSKEWMFDFDGAPSATEKRPVLLAATPRPRLAQISEAAAAAGLKILRAMPTSLALATAAASADGGALLHATDEGAELIVRADGRVVAGERLTAAPPRFETVCSEVRRVVAATTAGESPAKQIVIVWDSSAPAPPAIADLGQRTGMQSPASPELRDLAPINGKPRASGSMHGAAAAALGLAGLRHEGGIDFVHSKLADDQKPLITRMRLIGVAAALLVVAILAYLSVDWYAERLLVNDMQHQVDSQKSMLTTAAENVARFEHARGWYDKRPQYLECLREVTVAFPAGGQVWATSISVRDDLSGTLAGKAQGEKSVFDLIDRMRASRQFSEVKLLYMRQADRGSRVASFAVTFAYAGTKAGA